ncbi:F-box/kelch-repeat protein At3g23880-like [Cornus florida]|uniref:F-box/kelch-repeat protein At3g23880-like n=1 Tax=Cornus florida TaxID=4283 RepID=UPI00289A9668|nr:F-box/kelch-repeat protein At3g23880-like [Cornus florida]
MNPSTAEKSEAMIKRVNPCAADKSEAMIKRRRMRRNSYGDTPYEIIHIILLRLPVKSVLRFRCVSKSWLDAISDPQFARSRLNESIKFDRQSIIRWGYNGRNHKNFDSIAYDCSDNSQQKLCFPFKKYRKAAVLSCSCNGLVLLFLDDICVLWNPSTGAYKRFSRPPKYHNYPPRGFCYDSFLDDYKVLFFRARDFVVYSFRSQSWTEAKHFPYLGYRSGSGVIVNGVLHMVAYKDLINNNDNRESSTSARVGPPSPGRLGMVGTSDPPTFMFGDSYKEHLLVSCNAKPVTNQSKKQYGCVIVYFDTVDHKFMEMPSPNCINDGDMFDLTVLKGCLSLYFSTSDMNYFEVWTMEQYGEHHSWTKLIAIPHWIRERHISSLKLLCVTKEGKIVMILDDKKLFIYNPKNNTCTPLGQTEVDARLRAVSIVDSLVFPIPTPQGKGKS